MATHAKNGTNNPTLKLPAYVEVNPTTAGKVAPPTQAKANITIPERFASAPKCPTIQETISG